MKLSDFKKQDKKVPFKTSSVNLRPDQHEFLKKHDLELSRLVRKLIDDFIDSVAKKRPKKKDEDML